MKYQNLLAAQRKAHGLTCRDMGRLIDRSGDSVRGYEDGTHVPPIEVALRLEFLFGLSVSELLPEYFNVIVRETVPIVQDFSIAIEEHVDAFSRRKRQFIKTLSDRFERILPAV